MSPTVGVAIPALNAAAFLDQALGSIAIQTQPPDRIIVVDDGSTDATAAVALAWDDRLPVAVVSHHSNRGLPAARNTAVEALETDLVAFLDADDVWLPDHVSAMVATYDRNGGFVTPVALRWAPGHAIHLRSTAQIAPVPRRRQLERLLSQNFVFSGALVCARDYRRVGGSREFGGAVDWDLWIRLVEAGVRCSVTPLPTVLYRVHASSMSADEGCLEDEIRVLEAFIERSRSASAVRVASRALRKQRARAALVRSYQAARLGSTSEARREARRALAGKPAVVGRAAALVAAPRLAVRARDQARESRARGAR